MTDLGVTKQMWCEGCQTTYLKHVDGRRTDCRCSDADQPSFDFVTTHTHAHDPDTSVEAAELQVPTLKKSLRRAYAVIERSLDGITDGEGASIFYSFPKRRCDLYHMGLVEDSGRRRPSPRTKPMIVWVIATATELSEVDTNE